MRNIVSFRICNCRSSTSQTCGSLFNQINASVALNRKRFYTGNPSIPTSMRKASVMINKIRLALKIKDCHMIGVCRRGRFHNYASKCPLIAHNVICGGISHLLSPVTGKEHIIRSNIIAFCILLTVIIGSFCVKMFIIVLSAKPGFSIRTSSISIDLSDNNIKGSIICKSY